MLASPSPGPGPLLLFDGDCGLCQRLVGFLLARDRRAVMRYAPLQGATGQAILRRLHLATHDFDSLVFLPDAEGDQYLRRTAGVLGVLRMLGGRWQTLARLGGLVPAPLRDALYRVVARTRYALFGPARSWTEFNPPHRERILA